MFTLDANMFILLLHELVSLCFLFTPNVIQISTMCRFAADSRAWTSTDDDSLEHFRNFISFHDSVCFLGRCLHKSMFLPRYVEEREAKNGWMCGCSFPWQWCLLLKFVIKLSLSLSLAIPLEIKNVMFRLSDFFPEPRALFGLPGDKRCSTIVRCHIEAQLKFQFIARVPLDVNLLYNKWSVHSHKLWNYSSSISFAPLFCIKQKR
jgi:hypothetical protein